MNIFDAERRMEVWTDGAAHYADIPQLRRAGWGVWLPGAGSASISAALIGPCQTAQRAEVRAFVAALELTAGNARVWTDSKFVCRGAGFLEQGVLPPLKHADLWARAARAWRRGRSEVRWVKAHLEWQEAQDRGIPWHVWAGNQRADEFAGRGAASHAPAADDVRRVLGARDDLKRAQAWMVEALRLASAADPRPQNKRPARRSRKGRPGPRGPAASAGDHGPIQAVGGHWVCDACSRRVAMTRPWREWRRTPCAPLRRKAAPGAGPAVAAEEAPPGRVAHELVTEAGRTRCTRCGRSRLTR